jgi:hypothetical protein
VVPTIEKQFNDKGFDRGTTTDEDIIAWLQTVDGAKVKEVGVIHCDEVTDAGVIALAQGCPGLQTIYLDGCNEVTEKYRKTLNREDILGLGALMPPPPMGGMAGGAAESGEENGVYSSLAKMYSQKDAGHVGFPAFNKDKELLGFYQEEQVAVGNGEYTTQLKVRRVRQCGGSVHGGIYSVYRSFTD